MTKIRSSENFEDRTSLAKITIFFNQKLPVKNHPGSRTILNLAQTVKYLQEIIFKRFHMILFKQ